MPLSDAQREFLSALGCELPVELLNQALTHPSSIPNSSQRTEKSNQRLEFLGDAIIGTTVADHLYRTFSDKPEGVLTEYKIAVVRGESLALAARRLNFGPQLILGRGEENSGGRDREGILTDAFEAVTGAIYLTHGYVTTAEFIVRALAPEIAAVGHNSLNSKNQLQEFTQATGLGTPIYETTACADGGFAATVIIKANPSGAGRGRTKRAAESEAAQMAYEALKKGME